VIHASIISIVRTRGWRLLGEPYGRGKLDIHPKTRYKVSGPKIEISAIAQATFQFYKMCEDFYPPPGMQS
jgi:hypothetical protein